MKATLAVAALLATVFVGPISAHEERVIPNFALLDQDGRLRELARTDARVVVVSFVCGAREPVPCVRPETLKRLQIRYANKGVAVWAVTSRLGQSRKAVQDQATILGLGAAMPLLHDEATLVARAFGTSRLGETFAVDRLHRRVLFHGSLDGSSAPGLEKALDAFLQGRPPPQADNVIKGSPLDLQPAETPVSYETEVAPLIVKRCVSCHRDGEIAPFAFSSYQKAKGWGRTIQEVLLARRMPPWTADSHQGSFSNDISLSPKDADLLWRWVDQGAPGGTGKDPLEAPSPAAAAWPLGKPDFIVELPAPEPIPATGVLPYLHRVSTFVMPRDAWLRAAIAQPDNHAVVHHMTVYPKYPDGYHPTGEDSFLTGWAPGMTLGQFPAGTGKFVPKGTAFHFETHYTPNGKPQTDRSRLGLYLASGPLRPLETRFTWDEDLVVPAGDPDLRTQAMYGFRHDVELFDLIPHMHNRGTWVKYEALYPDGGRETLLSVPRYDFAWQSVYRLSHPKHIPAGTWLLITAGYDNSSLNPANPNPKARVRWGEQTWDEMFVPQFDVVESTSGAIGQSR